MPETTTLTETVLSLLNKFQEADPQACASLMAFKVPVTDKLDDDFICQTARGGKFNMTVLGLLNSALVKTGNVKVAAIVDDDGTVIGFTTRTNGGVAPVPAPPAGEPT